MALLCLLYILLDAQFISAGANTVPRDKRAYHPTASGYQNWGNSVALPFAQRLGVPEQAMAWVVPLSFRSGYRSF